MAALSRPAVHALYAIRKITASGRNGFTLVMAR
jgi:hypothetical protein